MCVADPRKYTLLRRRIYSVCAIRQLTLAVYAAAVRWENIGSPDGIVRQVHDFCMHTHHRPGIVQDEETLQVRQGPRSITHSVIGFPCKWSNALLLALPTRPQVD